jgi:hypothetical protein
MGEERLNNPDVKHERSDVNIRPILLFGLVMVIAGIIIHLTIWLMFSFFDTRAQLQLPRQYPLAAGAQNQLPPEPRLQTNPREDLKEFRAGEDQVLGSYGWIDKGAGVVRIPIPEAMKLTLDRGLPARPVASAPAGAATVPPGSSADSGGSAREGESRR